MGLLPCISWLFPWGFPLFFYFIFFFYGAQACLYTPKSVGILVFTDAALAEVSKNTSCSNLCHELFSGTVFIHPLWLCSSHFALVGLFYYCSLINPAGVGADAVFLYSLYSLSPLCSILPLKFYLSSSPVFFPPSFCVHGIGGRG